jgi:hypothetical protein
MFFQYGSESFKLFELLTYWDKVVHPVEIFLATGVVTYLLLGYRDLHRLDIPDHLSAAVAMLFGMTFGAAWELLEFAADWFGNANLQKSNADTMTDILTNDAGAIFGALLAFWLYRRMTNDHQRAEFGEIAEWLTARLDRLLTRHGGLVGILVALLFAGIIAAGWFVDRGPLPAPPGTRGQAQTWSFAPGADWAPSASALRGVWQPDERGICRVNPDRPRPGSEQMGLLALAPGASYGGDEGFVASTRLFLERPALGSGTAMEGGLAFGVRGPDDFYLLRLSALHDVVALERYVHGRKREQRQEHVLTHGDEWHELQARVLGDRVAATLDGRPILEEGGLLETDGGLGLWARVSGAGCFSQARMEPDARGLAAPRARAPGLPAQPPS